MGGFEVGLARAGVRMVAAVELDAAARGVLADRFPTLTLFSDVREVTGDQLIAAGLVPHRGIITAGWPCQGNSVAGRRRGMDDPHSGLWPHVVRLLAETRARWFIGENVPGLLSVRGGRDWATCLHDLAQLGMGFAWRILDAQHFGVPQRRRRLVIVGCAGGNPTGPVQVLLEPDSGRWDSAPSPPARPGDPAVTALSASNGGADARGGRLIAPPLRSNHYGDHVAAEAHLVNALTAHAGRNDLSADPLLPIAFDTAQLTHPENRVNPRPGDPAMPLAATGQPHVTYALRHDPGTPQGHNISLITSTLRSHPRPGSASPGMVTHTLTTEGHDATEDGSGRGTPLIPLSLAVGQAISTGVDIAQTVTRSKGQPGTVAAAAVRRLTPRECERLQGFPDDWTATSGGRPQSDSARYRQLGNALAVPVGEWIAHRLVAIESRGA